MAQIINIAGAQAIDDPEYRYKMPRIIGKVEGRGNGIKTAIPNMVDVASSLHRPPGEVTKFFGCELGAQTTYNDDTERSIVNGAHETRVLQDKLSVYIEKFVLCPACKLPETSYKIKHEIIYHNCLACGAREPCDMQHKLTTYILKQHKIEKKAKAKDKKDKGDKKDKKKKVRARRPFVRSSCRRRRDVAPPRRRRRGRMSPRRRRRGRVRVRAPRERTEAAPRRRKSPAGQGQGRRRRQEEEGEEGEEGQEEEEEGLRGR